MNLISSAGKQNALFYLFKKVWQYSGNRSLVALYWGLFVVAMVISLIATPFLMARMANIVTTQGVNADSVSALLPLFIGLLFVEPLFWAFHGPGRVLEQKNAFLLKNAYSKRLVRGVLGLPLVWHNEHHTGDTIDKVNKGSQALHDFAEISFMMIYSFVKFVVSLIILTYYSGIAGLIIICMVMMSVWVTLWFDNKYLVPLYDRIHLLENNISEGVTDVITNITTIVILRVQKAIYKTVAEKIDSPQAVVFRRIHLGEIKWCITSMLRELMAVLVFAVYLWKHYGLAAVNAGDFLLLQQYVRTIGELFFEFTWQYSEVIRRRSRVENAEILAKEFVDEQQINHVLPAQWSNLEVRHLEFAYNSDRILGDLSFSIKRGEKIVIIGKTGSGKTTLLKLMRGLWCPQRIELCVDGIPIREGFEGICETISLVPQSPELFTRSIRENITLGVEYDLDRIEECIDMACFGEVVDMLPDGLDSCVKEKGVELSGGQNQRLALARALLASYQKDIVLMDEPTSSMDPKTATRIYKNIFAGFAKKTILSSVHSLHVLPLFDRIIWFDEGNIIADGTFEYLMHYSPRFVSLWEAAGGEPAQSLVAYAM